MSGPSPPAPSVLLVGVSDESLLVLGESLARSGLGIARAGSVVAACERLDRDAVFAAVLDSDAVTAQELRLLIRRAGRSGAPIVLVGTNRPESTEDAVVFLRKPYHYRELIHKIQESLGDVGNQARAAA